MTETLTWCYLPPEAAHALLCAPDRAMAHAALIAAHNANASATGTRYRFLDTIYYNGAPAEQLPAGVPIWESKEKGDRGDNGAAPDTKKGTVPSLETNSVKPTTAVLAAAAGPSHTVVLEQPFRGRQLLAQLDLYYHLVLYARESGYTPEKLSAAFAVLAETHRTSMTSALSLSDSYSLFGTLLRKHSVHKPPFYSAVLSLEEAEALATYVTATYYRHYKLYLYVLTPRRVAALRGYLLADATQVQEVGAPTALGVSVVPMASTTNSKEPAVLPGPEGPQFGTQAQPGVPGHPPLPPVVVFGPRGVTAPGGPGYALPPQTSAIPLSVFEANQAEVAAAAASAREAAEAQEKARLEEERRAAEAAAAAARDPAVPQGLRTQLAAIRGSVAALSSSKLAELEAKLDTIEQRIVESQQQHGTGSRGNPLLSSSPGAARRK